LIHIAVQEALKVLPIVNENLVRRSAVLHKKSEEFYTSNQDLLEHKPVVAQVIERIESENPGLSFDEVLKRAAPEARTAIGAEVGIQKKTFGPTKNLQNLDDVVGKL